MSFAHIITDPAVHQAASNTWDAYDTKTAGQAGIFAGCVAGFLLLVKIVRAAGRKPATSN